MLVLVCLAINGCSSSPSSFGKVEVSEGRAVCQFPNYQTPYKLGDIADDGRVKMYRTYGGGTLDLNDIRRIVSTVTEDETTPHGNDAARALKYAFQADMLHGIWRLESLKIPGQEGTDDDDHFLIIRADKTYKIVKAGPPTEGQWILENRNKLIFTEDDSIVETAGFTRTRGDDKLTLTAKGDGPTATATYVLSDLTEEPESLK